MSRFSVTLHATDLLREAGRQHAAALWTDHRANGSGILHETGEECRLVDDAGRDVDGHVRMTFMLYGIPFFANCRIGHGRILRPVEIWSEDQRANPRVQSGGRAQWWTLNNGTPQTHGAELIDLAVDGARIRVPPGGRHPPQQSKFSIRIRAGGRPFDALATIRNVAVTEAGTEFGLYIESRRRDHLADVCIGSLVPELTLRRCVEADAVRMLFQDSGYLALREACNPSSAWLDLDLDRISRDLVFMADDGQPIGHVSVTRAYRKTWLGHQIAILRNHPQSMRARVGLYSAFSTLPTLLDGRDAYLLGYYNLSLPWHQLFFTHFADSVAAPELVTVVPWDRFERGLVPFVPHRDGDFRGTLGPVDPADAPVLVEIARSLIPPILADALDLHPDALVTDHLHPAFAGTSHDRRRVGFCLRENGAIAGFALCELTDSNLSLFNIMNMAQIFVLPSASTQGQQALHSEVLRYYERHGIADAIVVAPQGTFDGTLVPGTRLEETMGCIVWSGEALRAYENFLHLHFTWLGQGMRVQTRMVHLPSPRDTP